MSLTFQLPHHRAQNSPRGLSVPRLSKTTHLPELGAPKTTAWSGDRNSPDVVFGDRKSPTSRPQS